MNYVRVVDPTLSLGVRAFSQGQRGTVNIAVRSISILTVDRSIDDDDASRVEALTFDRPKESSCPLVFGQ